MWNFSRRQAFYAFPNRLLKVELPSIVFALLLKVNHVEEKSTNVLPRQESFAYKQWRL